jgi:predicted RND superfamily exporter protein
VPEVRRSFGLLSLFEVARGIALPAHAAGALIPETEAETERVWNLARTSLPGLVNALTYPRPEADATVVALDLEALPSAVEARRVARSLSAALELYRASPDKAHDLFVDSCLAPVGLLTGVEQIDAALQRDLLRLSPVAIGVIAIVLWVAFGVWQAAAAVLAVGAMGATWTLGAMGWLGTPLSLVTFAVIPFVLATGLNSGIVLTLETLDRRRVGLPARRTLRAVRRSATRPIALTTLAGCIGLLFLAAFTSGDVSRLALHAAFGAGATVLLASFLLPDLLLRVDPGRPSKFGPIISPLAASFAKNRKVVVIVAAIAFLPSIMIVRTPNAWSGFLPGFLPQGSASYEAFRRFAESCRDAFPGVIVARGELATPEAMGALTELEDRLRASPLLQGLHVVGPSDVLGAYLVVNGKPASQAAAVLPQARRFSVASREDLESAAGALHTEAPWAALAAPFFDRELETGTLWLVDSEPGSSSRTRVLTAEVERLLAAFARSSAAPLELTLVADHEFRRRLAATSQRDLYFTLAVVSFVVTLASALFFRSAAVIFVVLVLLLVGVIWWLALLRLAGIELSPFLLFPGVFVTGVASGYGLHMLARVRADWSRLEHDAHRITPVQWTWSAWSTTGRGIAIAALTDLLVYLVYSRMKLPYSAVAMRALALAVATVFGSTIFLVPALFPRRGETDAPTDAPTPHEADRAERTTP